MPRDDRTYITVHDGMPDHPKVEELSDAAFRLLVTAWCWSSRNKTDGQIKAASWAKRGTAKARLELIAAGLAEETTEGVEMHDYLEHQRSAAEIEALVEKRRLAGSKGGKAKANALASAKQVLEQTGSKDVADTETDTEEKTTSSLPRKRACRLPVDWKPTEVDIAWQRAKGIPDSSARSEFEKFCNYWRAKAGKDAAKLDWSLTWHSWLLNALERQPQRPQDDASRARIAARQANPLASAL
jgi:hypothetical protein